MGIWQYSTLESVTLQWRNLLLETTKRLKKKKKNVYKMFTYF